MNGSAYLNNRPNAVSAELVLSCCRGLPRKQTGWLPPILVAKPSCGFALPKRQPLIPRATGRLSQRHRAGAAVVKPGLDGPGGRQQGAQSVPNRFASRRILTGGDLGANLLAIRWVAGPGCRVAGDLRRRQTPEFLFFTYLTRSSAADSSKAKRQMTIDFGIHPQDIAGSTSR